MITSNRSLIHTYPYCLQYTLFHIRTAYVRVPQDVKHHIANADAWDLAKRAQRIWEVQKQRKRRINKRRFDGYTPRDFPSKRPRNNRSYGPGSYPSESYPPRNDYSQGLR